MSEDVRRPTDLYAVRPERFTATRQALVAALRRAGDTRAAAEAAAIKRPTLPLWAVNQLARHNRTAVVELIGSAERLQAAQLGRPRGGDLREAADTYQAMLKQCEEEANALLRQASAGLTVALRIRLARTLAAAAADPALRPALREGRLPHEVTSAGFDVFGARLVRRVTPPPAEEAPVRPPPVPRPAPKPDHERLRRLMQARTALAEAEAALEGVRAEAAQLTRIATDAQTRADEAKRAAERCRSKEAAALARVAEAQQALRAAEAAPRP